MPNVADQLTRISQAQKKVDTDRYEDAVICRLNLGYVWRDDILLSGVSVHTVGGKKSQIKDTAMVKLSHPAEYWFKKAYAIMDKPYEGSPSTFKGAIVFFTKTQDELARFARDNKPSEEIY